jgi:MFS family permease
LDNEKCGGFGFAESARAPGSNSVWTRSGPVREMGDYQDPEKDDSREKDATACPESRPNAASSLEKETQTSFSRTHSLHSSHWSSSDSINSDPLAPLEHALTPNLFTDVEQMAREEITYTRTRASITTTGSRPVSFEVDFETNDPDDPRNWPLWYRGLLMFTVSFATWTVILYSTSYTSGMPGMMKEFHEGSETVATLGVTVYLVGLAVGSLILAPMSEIYGRRPVYTGSMLFFFLMVLPCALATRLSEVLVVRFFGYAHRSIKRNWADMMDSACAGAAMISNSPGTISDIVTENYRALAFSIWSIGPMNGPVTGPLIGGFVAEYLGWRWTNWVVMILAGAGWFMVASMKETYAPVILQKKAARKRKETGDERYWSRYDQKLTSRFCISVRITGTNEKSTVIQILKVNLSRPFVLTFTEPILWFWDAYIGVSIPECPQSTSTSTPT